MCLIGNVCWLHHWCQELILGYSGDLLGNARKRKLLAPLMRACVCISCLCGPTADQVTSLQKLLTGVRLGSGTVSYGHSVQGGTEQSCTPPDVQAEWYGHGTHTHTLTHTRMHTRMRLSTPTSPSRSWQCARFISCHTVHALCIPEPECAHLWTMPRRWWPRMSSTPWSGCSAV